MIHATQTTTALLDGLHDRRNNAAWLEFDQRYRPILTNLAQRMGCREAEAHDAAQSGLAEFAEAYSAGRYDRSKGRLRAWLIGIAKRQVFNVLRDRRSDAARGGDQTQTSPGPDLGQVPSDEELTSIWDQERRREILRRAFEDLRAGRSTETTLRAFELVAIRGVPVAEVARELSISTHDVYLAKSRCLQQLKSRITTLETAYDED